MQGISSKIESEMSTSRSGGTADAAVSKTVGRFNNASQHPLTDHTYRYGRCANGRLLSCLLTAIHNQCVRRRLEVVARFGVSSW